jgi:ApaG protein
MYQESTRNLEVKVVPQYLPDQSDPEVGLFFYAYHVELVNKGMSTVQLLKRHWIITDGKRRVEHVEGDGVVGLQPVLRPGESFRYTSGCPLQTPTGNMRGSYLMMDEDGQRFQATIPLFFLRQ